MLNDSVREELASKISPLARAVRTETSKTEIKDKPVAKPVTPPVPSPVAPVESPVAVPIVVSVPRAQAASAPPAPKPPAPEAAPLQMPRTITAELTSKPTSSTLVEFYNKNASLPEWRLQLQNSVRMRGERGNRSEEIHPQSKQTPAAKPQRAALATKGATALQPEYAEKPAERAEPVYPDNPKLAAALRRIEASRRQYFADEKETAIEPPQAKTFPYVVTSKAPENPAKRTEAEPISDFAVKPKFVSTDVAPKSEKFDTNKLPPLPVAAKIAPGFEQKNFERTTTIVEKPLPPAPAEKKTFLNCEVIDEIDLLDPEIGNSSTDTEAADDRAPVALRFNAGLFDLIIGAFSSALLLSPFMLAGGNLFTFESGLAFLVTLSIVMFIYLTASIGLMGRTLGMRLFSLEVVDIEENAYPSLHQAAVSSSVYLLSLAFGGVGFLTLFLNDEKRAAHDLLSGTIVVKEY